MNKIIYIFINGILTFPGDAANWTGRAVTWVQTRSPHKAEKVEYYAGPLDRVFGQAERAQKLSRTLEFYSGWDIVLVGHSNGCDVILDALRARELPDLAELHLISGACEADFDINGLNDALLERDIDSVRVYVAGRDKWLRLASTWTGKLFGYGTLGLHGALDVAATVAQNVTETLRPNYGHSDWFAPEHFGETMRGICPEATV